MNKIKTFSKGIKELNFWFALKWTGILIIVLYFGVAIGQQILRDFTGYRINYSFSISYESDGLLKPIVEAK